ncbi:MAG: putative alpha/beta-fold hydrolase [Candidatus Azotimanducaceae bacterium]|jgi:predicted alpha/beta-fold hydrolase
MSILEFKPPPGLGGGHIQTVLGSSLRKVVVPGRVKGVVSAEREKIFSAADGTRLVAWISEQPQPAPLIVIIHGWLGSHNSGYNLSLAECLWANGFSVARLNLRDHGGTTHLNEGMFHNGLIDEVVDVVGQIKVHYGQVGIVGFSLGGNFALRLAKMLKIPAVGVCPLMDPAASIVAVDRGWTLVKAYFMRKWLRALDEKALAFPDRYQFRASGAYELKTVHGMTEHFIENYTSYATLQDYYDCYTLTGDFLDGVEATIIAAADDPVVPAEGFQKLPSSLNVNVLPKGGHCAFIDSYRMTSYVDGYVVKHFQQVSA